MPDDEETAMDVLLLQWSRSPKRAEIAHTLPPREAALNASMEPLSEESGDTEHLAGMNE